MEAHSDFFHASYPAVRCYQVQLLFVSSLDKGLPKSDPCSAIVPLPISPYVVHFFFYVSSKTISEHPSVIWWYDLLIVIILFFQKQKCMAYIVFSNTAKDCSISLRNYCLLTNVMQFPIAATDNIFINWKVYIDMSCSLLCFASESYSFSDWSEPTVLEHVCVCVCFGMANRVFPGKIWAHLCTY